MGADQDLDVAALASAASFARRSAPLSRPVSSSSTTPAASASGRRPSRCWRARISVGRHHHALPARLDRDQQRHERHQRLARADIALQQPVHPHRLRHIRGDLRDRAGLRAGGLIGQRGQYLALQLVRSPTVASPLPLRRRRRAPAPGSADAPTTRHRPAAGGPARSAPVRQRLSGCVRCLQRGVCQAGQPSRACSAGSIHSARSGSTAERRGRPPCPSCVWVRPGGQRIDRFESGISSASSSAQDVVGVDHLRDAVEQLDLARHHAALPGRQAALQPVARARERTPAGTWSAHRAPRSGRAGPCARRQVAADLDLDRQHLRANPRPGSSRGGAGRYPNRAA